MADVVFPITDFPMGKCAVDRLAQEIRQSSIAVALRFVKSLGVTVTCVFAAGLSAGELVTLQGIVATHSGVPLAPPSKPQEIDGKEIVTPFPGFVDFNTVFTGRGDDLNAPTPDAGRGRGESLLMEWTALEVGTEKSKILRFSEPIQLHDGAAYYQGGWSPADTLSVGAEIPATPVTANPTNTGNCNLAVHPDVGLPIIIVPAAGDGTHDVDLASACPVPDPNRSGFWDVDEPSDAGIISPSSTPLAAKWHLLTVPTKANYLHQIPLGALTGVFDLEVYRAEYFHPSWSLVVRVKKVSEGSGIFNGWFLVYRRYNPTPLE